MTTPPLTPPRPNLGRNPDNYVVDLQFRTQKIGTHQRQYGGTNRIISGLHKNSISNGAWWTNLTSKSIIVRRGYSDKDVEEVRVRIWVYR